MDKKVNRKGKSQSPQSQTMIYEADISTCCEVLLSNRNASEKMSELERLSIGTLNPAIQRCWKNLSKEFQNYILNKPYPLDLEKSFLIRLDTSIFLLDAEPERGVSELVKIMKGLTNIKKELRVQRENKISLKMFKQKNFSWEKLSISNQNDFKVLFEIFLPISSRYQANIAKGSINTPTLNSFLKWANENLILFSDLEYERREFEKIFKIQIENISNEASLIEVTQPIARSKTKAIQANASAVTDHQPSKMNTIEVSSIKPEVPLKLSEEILPNSSDTPVCLSEVPIAADEPVMGTSSPSEPPSVSHDGSLQQQSLSTEPESFELTASVPDSGATGSLERSEDLHTTLQVHPQEIGVSSQENEESADLLGDFNDRIEEKKKQKSRIEREIDDLRHFHGTVSALQTALLIRLGLPPASELVKRIDDELALKERELKRFQKEIDLLLSVKSFINVKLTQLSNEKRKLLEDNHRLNIEVDRLKVEASHIPDLERRIEQTTEELEITRGALEQEKQDHEAIKKEFSEDQKQQIESSLSDFKGILSGKLLPIFREGQTAERQSPDEASTNLKHRFTELRQLLEKEGIRVSREF